MLRQRLDKWLWHARLAKTRSLATKLIAAGKVRVNAERSLKASREIVPGDVVTCVRLGKVVVVRVRALAERRLGAALAQTLYEDISPAQPREREDARAGGPRPTKRDRRRLDALRSLDR